MQEISKNRIQQLQKLKQKKYRDLHNQFILSGLRGVSTVIQISPEKVDTILLSKTKENHFTGLIRNKKPSTEVFTLSDRDFSAISDEKNPQGIAAICKKPSTRFSEQIALKGKALFLDRVRDPGNLGTIIRSAAWFGINTILLSTESVDPFAPKVVRSTAGSIWDVLLYENISINNLKQLKSLQNYTFFATDVEKGQAVSTITIPENTVFLFGNEAHGLSPHYNTLIDKAVHIKKVGHGESLNLANAISIILYQATLV